MEKRYYVTDPRRIKFAGEPARWVVQIVDGRSGNSVKDFEFINPDNRDAIVAEADRRCDWLNLGGNA